eukprot:scaffold386_cov174-Ochromonas_danica.AAC.5
MMILPLHKVCKPILANNNNNNFCDNYFLARYGQPLFLCHLLLPPLVLFYERPRMVLLDMKLLNPLMPPCSPSMTPHHYFHNPHY